MKKLLSLTALVVYSAITFSQIPNYVPTNGLKGWYPFTGNANDLSPLGNNGTVNGAALTTDRNGNTNCAYSFDGVNDYIQLPLNAGGLQGVTQFTLSYWVNPSTTSNTPRTIFALWGPSVPQNTPNGFYASIRDRPYLNYLAGLEIGNLSSISANNWFNVIIIYDGTQVTQTNRSKVYINGLLTTLDFSCTNCSSNTPTQIPANAANNTSFGARLINSVYAEFLNGKLDDIGFWNRVLTQQEITNLYNYCANTTATILPNGNTTFCQGGSVVLQASSGSSYNWSNGATTQSITVTQGNTYTVTVTDGNGCTATASQVVTVNPNPSVSLSLPTITNLGAAAFNMNGNPSGGTYTGAGVSGNSFNPANAGLGLKSVSYNYTNGNGCSGSASSTTLVYDTTGVVCTSYDTVTTTVNDTVTTYLSVTDTLKIDVNLTGINPPNNSNLLTVYPNPAKDHLLINCGNYASMSGYSIKITNTLGQVVFNQPVNQQQFYIDLSTWGGAGTYIMYITDQNQTVKSQKQIILQ